MIDPAQIGRLALRHEGSFWNAYYAKSNTMDGALLLGSVAMAFVEDNAKIKQAFIELMCEAVADIIERAAGVRPVWPNAPQLAPESERSGHG